MHSFPAKKRTWTHQRVAFTLIETLVVVAVIGLLVGLILPAVQAAREAARRAQCGANLRQIGIGMAHYYDIHQIFPPVYMTTYPPGNIITSLRVSIDYLSPHVFILPYLDQIPLYNSINMPLASNREALGSPYLENHTARNTRLSIYLCPSDGETRHLNSYRFNRGRFKSVPPGLPYDGPFSIGVLPSQANITDGLSQTAFVSERVGGSFVEDANDPRRDIKTVSTDQMISSDEQYISICLGDPHGHWTPIAGRFWFYTGFTSTNYNHNAPPNDPRPTCGFPPGGNDSGPGGLSPPRSFHPGTVNVLFGDAHVAAVTNSVSIPVWMAQGTYNKGD